MKSAVKWLNRAADRRGGIGLATLMVGVFATAHVVNTLFVIELPQVDESLAWAAAAGRIIGAGVAFFTAFAMWLYLSFGVYFVLRFGTRDLSAAAVTRRTGIAFVYPLLGLVASIIVRVVGLPGVVSNGIYWTAVVFGFAMLAAAISSAGGRRPVLTIIAVTTPVLAAAAGVVLLGLVGQALVPVEPVS
ncbi:MAG: hypothetical protein F4Y16_08870 [Holophagales bacterium]|nr:hypothetical protein [Holophagales bacterium]MYH25183.1 hypothetical protein [Holophagales bacterium]